MENHGTAEHTSTRVTIESSLPEMGSATDWAVYMHACMHAWMHAYRHTDIQWFRRWFVMVFTPVIHFGAPVRGILRSMICLSLSSTAGLGSGRMMPVKMGWFSTILLWPFWVSPWLWDSPWPWIAVTSGLVMIIYPFLVSPKGPWGCHK